MSLTEEHLLIQSTAKQFADSILRPQSAEWAKSHTFPQQAITELSQLGFLGMLVPEQYHGSPTGFLGYTIAIEEIAAGDASTSTILSVHNSLVCGALLNYGTEEQKEKWLKPLATGSLLGCFCLTEPEAGSDAGNIKSHAKLKENNYILNGTKQFITSGKHADIAIIFAKTKHTSSKKDISAFIVPTHSSGYIIAKTEEKMGQEASETNQIILDNLHIPIENRLGNEEDGYKIALSQLAEGRIGIAAQSIGIAREALETSIHFAKERITFGKPIFEHQAISFKLAEMATRLEAARQLIYHAARLKDLNLPCKKEACMAKLFATETSEYICREAIQIHGGYGYIKDFPVERLYRDVRVTTLYEGTSEIQKMIISQLLA